MDHYGLFIEQLRSASDVPITESPVLDLESADFGSILQLAVPTANLLRKRHPSVQWLITFYVPSPDKLPIDIVRRAFANLQKSGEEFMINVTTSIDGGVEQGDVIEITLTKNA